MKRGMMLGLSVLMLLGTVGLMKFAEPYLTKETIREAERWVLGSQLAGRAELAPEETTQESSPTEETPGMSASPPPSAMPVPVTTVEEAWDEVQREMETVTETSPEPVKVAGQVCLELRNETDYEVDFTELPALRAGLDFSADKVSILIIHTHGTEAYMEQAAEGYHSLEEQESVIAVGESIRSALEQRGYGVYHDKRLCDYPEYTGAYNRSRTLVEEDLAAYPDTVLVLDVHRDAVTDASGEQMRMSCTVDGVSCAQLMLVVGTNAGGLYHPEWEENLSLAAVLQTEMTGRYGDMMRPLNLRTERFNQDLAPLCLLIEVGASGNSLDEAMRSAEFFAACLADTLDRYCGKSS